ncbi:MAG TPA: hypothetical protein PKA13_25780 [Geminicoccaceae bacterium]|nr:hypothetical protein [Geminicoccus sp.]HMU53209.1 hypothetical protein [Geminicoccaceae bacterium]
MPLDPTPAQSEASRRNARHSTGPVTEAGKAAASRNAVRHGLRGGSIEVFPEERSFLADMTASLEARWRPADIVERDLVQTIALISLKLVRLDAIEMQVLATCIEEPDGKRLPSLSTLIRYRARLTKERWEAEHRLRLAITQRCTNEAETRKQAVADGRRGFVTDEAMSLLEESRAAGADPRQPLLNREQRRRLAAVQRKAA